MCALKKWVDNQQQTVASENLTCGDTTFKAWNGSSMEKSSVITMKVPKYFEIQEQNCIITWGWSFTEGHDEIAGDESVPHVPVKEKKIL